MSTIHTLINFGIIIGSTTAFIIILIKKLGIRDIIISRAPKLFSQLFDCDFCLSFWISVIFVIILVYINKDISMLIIPFLSTPISRFLL